MLKSFIKQNIRAVVCLGLVILIFLGFIVRLAALELIVLLLILLLALAAADALLAALIILDPLGDQAVHMVVKPGGVARRR